MDVKIFTSSTEVKPLTSNNPPTDGIIEELKKVWRLNKGQIYKIVISQSADMFNGANQEDPCSYFDLIITVNTMESLSNLLQCRNVDVNNSGSFVDFYPDMINQNDLNFEMNGLYTLRYPSDFKRSKFGIKTRNDLIFTSMLALQDPFTISATVAFDVYMADF